MNLRTIGEQRIERPRYPIIQDDAIFRYCVVDSRNRNIVSYPYPNNYNYELNQVYRDIVYIEIINACIKPNKYNITTANNTVTVVIDGATYTLNITPGHYPLIGSSISSYQSLGEIFTTELSYLGGNIGLRYNANQDVFYFYETGTPSSLTAYSILGASSSLTAPIGFPSSTISNAIAGSIVVTSLGSGLYRVTIQATAGIISSMVRAFYINDNDLYYELNYGTSFLIRKTTISEFQYTSTTIEFITNVVMTPTASTAMNGYISILVGTTTTHLVEPCYLLLDIPELQRLEGNQTAINKTFFQVPIGSNYRIYDNSNSNISLYFNPPLPKLERIKVRFMDENGNLYDFGTRNEHAFTLGIRELNNNRQTT
jgi:hypothetical protein